MKLLIVEDDESIIEALKVGLLSIGLPPQITACGSRDAALAAIDGNTFDYAVLDLKIPASDGQLDSDVNHGRVVYERIRADSPGTPICLLTGYATEDLFTEICQQNERVDVWGAGKLTPMVDFYRKGRLNDIAPLVHSVQAEIAATDQLELIANPAPAFPENRILRIFGRRNGGASLVVEKLSGGLSGIRVLRAKIRDSNGVERFAVAARLGTRMDIRKEIDNYNRDVIRLPNGSFSVYAGEVFFGAGAAAGVFYRLIPAFESLGSILEQDPARAAAVVRKLQAIEMAWTSGHPQTSRTIAEIRRNLVSDEQMLGLNSLLDGISWTEFERNSIQVILSCQHGDLHLQNILVRSGDEPILIDYAEVGKNAVSLDAISLELSPLFHPSSHVCSASWPLPAHLENWTDVDKFAESSPIEQFIRATRGWAIAVAAGNRERLAVGYAYAVRQMLYADTNKAFAQSIIRSVISSYQ